MSNAHPNHQPKSEERENLSQKNGLETEELPEAEVLGRGEALRVEEDGQLQLLPGDQYVIDEMNLIELPFCVLSKDNRGLATLPLSPSGDEYLQANSKKHGLPTALARRTVLGLMWKTMEANNFKGGVLRFELRDLVENWMYPSRFQKYRAGGKLLAAAEKELNRVADTRIHSERWYDKALGRQTQINAAIIDYVQVIEPGGKNSPRVLEILWGAKLMQSIQAKYTKGLDMQTWLQIGHPLDEVLYRWLDRQLDSKSAQEVASCQRFARFKLGMHGGVLDREGRTASSYIADKLGEALERLNGIGFAVRMSVDKSKDDFSLRFEKITARANEVVENDLAGDLVREFRRHCHGLPADAKRTRISENDRQHAAEWVKAYGFEQAAWMVRRCRELHEKGVHAGRPLYSFAGLAFYENVAASDYERWKREKAGQLRLAFAEQRKRLWDAYCETTLKRAEKALGEVESAELEAKARARVSAHHKGLHPSESTVEKLVAVELRVLKLERADMMPEGEFMDYETDELLREALARRHGADPLGSA